LDKTIKTVVFWAVIVVSAFLLFQVVKSSPPEGASREISYSQFMSVVDSGDVAKVTITGSRIRGQYRSSGGTFWLIGPANQALLLDTLHQKGTEIWFKDSGGDASPVQLLGNWAPLLLLGALWFFMIRQMKSKSVMRVGGSPGVDNNPQ
jgi:cell division protease FtsH